MKELITVCQTEWIKLKKSSAIWLIISGAVFIPVFFISNIVYKWKDYLQVLVANSSNPWNEYSRKFFNGEHFTFLPMLLILVIALVFNVEYKSNGWKHLFVLPISKSKIFIGKYLILLTLLILFYTLVFVCYILGGTLLSVWKPGFGFLNHYPSYQYGGVEVNILLYLFKSFVSGLAILAIHFWLSFRLKNLFIVMAIGLAGVVLAMSLYIAGWESINYMPYGFPVLMCNYVYDHHILSNFQINSLLYFIAILFLSYLDFVIFFKGR